MAPSLRPDDVITTRAWPWFDRWRRPIRFSRWIVESPADGPAVKRVVGLPGETVALTDGDLVVNGRTVLKSPALLAEVAVVSPIPSIVDDRQIRLDRGEVLDDVPFAVEVNRPLLPVRDAGIAAVVTAGAEGGRVGLDVDRERIVWRLGPGHRVCLVAGRLDGHRVAVAWRLPHDTRLIDDRLPAGAPAEWGYAATWSGDSGPDTLAPAVAIHVIETAAIERAWPWRDVLVRPSRETATTWTLAADAYFLLGDFPTASHDSREWGPRPRSSLWHALAR